MVIDRLAQLVLCPFNGVWVCPFAREVQRAKAAQVVFLDEFAFGVFAFHGTNGRGGGEKAAHVIFFDDAPERTCIGGADGLAFKHHGGVAMDQRAVADITVADNPTDI